ncbi:MAG: hypothetical protein IPN60_18905 [Saprospiraceae bacterium]|nr:hypothetical protein [Candidatus Opimibacter skivensis]
MGPNTLLYNKGNNGSTAIGYQAMMNPDTSEFFPEQRTTYNTAIGYESLKGNYPPWNNTGIDNTATGAHTLKTIVRAAMLLLEAGPYSPIQQEIRILQSEEVPCTPIPTNQI